MSRKIEQQKLALPRGGGAVAGLGESFQANAFSGTAGITIPVYTTPARDFSPTLAVEYGSGGGNGPFGLGCSLELGSVSRQTRLRIPRYDDTDVFVLGSRELTPKLGGERVETVDGVVWRVREYLPRVRESLSLAERWLRDDTGESHWRTVSRDGVETVYGKTAGARIADPADAARVFEWLVEEEHDTKGNRIVYGYRPEDRVNVPDTLWDADRGAGGQKYPDTIRYGNYFADDTDGGEAFAFEVVFDYGERDLDGSDPAATVRGWTARQDPFSSYRSGFEIRTWRLCHAVLVFHHFPAELGDAPCLVRATRFAYDQTPTFSFLRAATQEGFRRDAEGALTRAALPPLTLSYSRFAPPPAPVFTPLRVAGGAAPIPNFLDGADLQAVDLDGEGLPGLLYADGTSTLYYRPLGDGVYAPPAPPRAFPDARQLDGAAESLRDLDGDGLLELVVQTDTLAGYFPRGEDGGWGAYRAFAALPTAAYAPGTESADLEGDGRADLLTFDASGLVYYPSEGTEGFGGPVRRLRAPGFPIAARGEGEVVLFADVFGDGLQHRLRVRDGTVEAWPSLGYGRFGPPIKLGNAPRFVAGVSAPRISVADVDGSGTADLVFAYADRVEVHRNQSGNSFAAPISIALPTSYAQPAQVTFADVRGTGSTAMVVSAPDPAAGHWFVEFPGAPPEDGATALPALKPYLLVRMENGMGAAVELRYASSTRFYLDDRRAGRPWATRLPFPVQVVEEAVTTDAVSGTRLVTRWRYHDGCWDALERTFNGFGHVESWDAETLPGPMPPGAALPTGHVPAAHTKTWFHTGTLLDSSVLRAQYQREYFSGDPEAYVMPESFFDPAIAAEGAATVRQAYAALKGRELHREVYGLDASASEGVPFTVAERNYEVRLLQPAAPGAHASFYVRDRETLEADYEREPADPRLRHEFFLDTTLFDPPASAEEYRERRCTVFYGRRPSVSPDVYVYPEQAQLKGEASVARFTRVTAPFRRVGDAIEARKMELAGLHLTGGARYFTFDAIRAQVESALGDEVAYGAPFTGGLQSRPMEWERVYYWNEAQDAALPLGATSPRGLEHHVANAVFTDAWLAETYGDRVDATLLRDTGGYALDGATWWNRGLVRHYATEPAAFHLPVGVRNDFAWEAKAAGEDPAPGLFVQSTAAWDAPYALAVVREADVLSETVELVTTAAIDYQAMEAWETVDANGVVRQALPDPLGRVLATSVFKPADGDRPREGDGDLRNYVVRDGATFDDVLARKPYYLQEASAFFFYANPTGDQPAAAVRLERQVHVSDLGQGEESPIEAAAEYTDGLGRLAETRTQAEPGPALVRGADGRLRRDDAGRVVEEETEARWIVSGTTIHNNKGLPAEVYFPFYADTARWRDPGEVAASGAVPPPSVTRYDPLGRVVRVDTPKGFFSRAVYTSWTESRYDLNDTVTQSAYYRAHIDEPGFDPAERQALEEAARCENTPEITVWDNTRVPIREIASNLGDVPPDAFAAIVAGSGVTSQALWGDLVARGYLETSETEPVGTWITGLFRPYVPGFALELAPDFQPFAAAVTEMLRQGGLQTFLSTDASGRVVEESDPRLFYSAVTGGSPVFSFRYAYPMGAETAARTVGADAGDRRALPNVLGSTVAAWDGRGQTTTWSYDTLQRTLTTTVADADGATRLAESTEYGEAAPDAAAYNLRGRAWRVCDPAGVETMSAYHFQGEVAEESRQFCADYRTEPDWSGTVALDPEVYATGYRYDALLRPTTRITPDGTTWTAAYHLSGRMRAVSLAEMGAEPRAYVTDTAYTAGDERLRVVYGNGVEQTSAYEWTTRRLIGLRATRPVAAVRGDSPSPVLQDAAYTWDPVGNLTLTVDRTAETVFCYNQAVEPRAASTYDPLYRLVAASGRQHPGITATTHLTGFKQSLFAELCPAAIADQVKLERYDEAYLYDDSGNLVELRHVAMSASFTRSQPVEADSNRLQGTAYDGDGNPLTLALANTVGLAWDFRDQLRSTTTIDRPGGVSDADWFCYDHAGRRARRVVERVGQGGTVVEVDDTRYVGTYRVRRVTLQGATASSTLRESRSLHVMEEEACAAVRLTWVSGAPGGAPDGTARDRFQVPGLQGSVSLEVDASAAVLSYEEYYPYGGTSLIAGPSMAEVEPKELRYSGQEADDSTGLYDYGARLYAPWLGRWLTPDPAGTVDGLNLFAFVGGNPTSWVDEGGTVKKKNTGGTAANLAKKAAAKAKVIQKPLILQRKGTPTAWTRRNMTAGTADYDAAVLKRAGKKTLPDIHAAHRLSDKGLRIVINVLTEVASGSMSLVTTGSLLGGTTSTVVPTGTGGATTTTGNPAALKLLQSFKKSVWSDSGQTKAQIKKVEAGFKLLETSLTTGTAPSASAIKTIATTATTISNTSLKNLYPGDASHNMSRGEKPDFRTITSGTGAKLQRRLTPTSTELAEMLKQFRDATGTAEASVTFGHDPKNVPKTYTSSASK